MVQAITESLVPFTWFLVPVFIAALALGLLILFAFQTSRAAKWFLFWLDARGIRRPEGRFRTFLVRRAKQRSARPSGSAGGPEAEDGVAARGFLKTRARQRLQEKTGIEPKRSVAERLDVLSAKSTETPLAPSVPEETLRRLEARARGTLRETARPAQALQTSRQMTESMVRSLEEQVRQGLLTPQTFEELKARLVAKHEGGGQRS